MTNEIQPFDGSFAVLDPEMRELLEENMGGEMDFRLSDLPMVTFPGVGDQRWVVKSPAGEERRDAIEGVVLGQTKRRAFYLNKYDGGDDPPDCSSNDGVTGRPLTNDEGVPQDTIYDANGNEYVYGGACVECPFDQWESARLLDSSYNGQGKACRESRVLLVLPPGSVRPMVLRLPATALRTWSSFAWDLTDRGLTLSKALLRFTLEGSSGQTAQLRVDILSKLEAETAATLRGLMPDIKRPQIEAPAEDAASAAAPTMDQQFNEELAPAEEPF